MSSSTPQETEIYPPAGTNRNVPPSPATAKNEEDKKPWMWLFIGLGAGFFLNFIALIPLLFVSDLKDDKRKRKFYVLGVLPFIIVDIILIIMLIALAVTGVVFGTRKS